MSSSLKYTKWKNSDNDSSWSAGIWPLVKLFLEPGFFGHSMKTLFLQRFLNILYEQQV
jgi:hypothetical protein